MSSSVEIALSLVGAKVWDAFFPQAAVTDMDVCPYQLRILIFTQLKLMADQLKVTDQLAAEAKAAFEAASGNWVKKKARCSPYGA